MRCHFASSKDNRSPVLVKNCIIQEAKYGGSSDSPFEVKLAGQTKVVSSPRKMEVEIPAGPSCAEVASLCEMGRLYCPW